MSILIKTPEEIIAMRESGKILAEVLDILCKSAKPGMSTYELETAAENFILSKSAIPAFKGFYGYPNALCTCLNEKVVHGIPSKTEIIKEGDLLTIDCGVKYKSMITDAARSIVIGKGEKYKYMLVDAANLALEKATEIAKPGTYIGEISKIIESVARENGIFSIRDLTGHGVGRYLHEDPVILNYFDGNMGPKLAPGMTIAIEPIFGHKTYKIQTLKDGWTIVTSDNSCAVQAENTILITQEGNEILTKL